jgi:hypothetical protein
MLNRTKDFALVPAELGGYESYADDLRIELVAGAATSCPKSVRGSSPRARSDFFENAVGD